MDEANGPTQLLYPDESHVSRADCQLTAINGRKYFQLRSSYGLHMTSSLSLDAERASGARLKRTKLCEEDESLDPPSFGRPDIVGGKMAAYCPVRMIN